MIKIFFITFFIAELIIAFAVIFKIHKFNKKVNELNEEVLMMKEKLKLFFPNLRLVLKSLNEWISIFKNFLKKKKDECLLKFSKTSLAYTVLAILKGRYKKMFLGYQIGKEFFEGLREGLYEPI